MGRWKESWMATTLVEEPLAHLEKVAVPWQAFAVIFGPETALVVGGDGSMENEQLQRWSTREEGRDRKVRGGGSPARSHLLAGTDQLRRQPKESLNACGNAELGRQPYKAHRVSLLLTLPQRTPFPTIAHPPL